MTREEVVELLLSARTAEEYDGAEGALDAWMQQHPDDHTIRDAARGLTLFRLDPLDEPSGPTRPTLDDIPEAERAYYTSPEYAASFEDDVRAAMERFAWDYAEAYDFVAPAVNDSAAVSATDIPCGTIGSSDG